LFELQRQRSPKKKARKRKACSRRGKNKKNLPDFQTPYFSLKFSMISKAMNVRFEGVETSLKYRDNGAMSRD
jgi:hypothetical protein